MDVSTLVGKLIDIPSLVQFGEEEIVPIKETISTLATALGLVSDQVDALERTSGLMVYSDGGVVKFGSGGVYAQDGVVKFSKAAD